MTATAEDDYVKLIRRALEVTEGQVVVLGYDPRIADVLYYTCRRNKRQLFTLVVDEKDFNKIQETAGRWHRPVLLKDWEQAHYDWNRFDPITAGQKAVKTGLGIIGGGLCGDVLECEAFVAHLQYCEVVVAVANKDYDTAIYCDTNLHESLKS